MGPEAMKTATANFDCVDIYQEHAFLVRLTKGRARQVQVFEVFGRLPAEREAQWAPETILRCEAAREIWDIISPEALLFSASGLYASKD
jgi:hypothetical protein